MSQDQIKKTVPSAVFADVPSKPAERVRIVSQYTFFDPKRPQQGINPSTGRVLDMKAYVPLEPGQVWLDQNTIGEKATGKPIMCLRWGGPDPRQASNNAARGFGAYRHPETGDAVRVGEMTLLARSPEADRASSHAKLVEMTSKSFMAKSEAVHQTVVSDSVSGKVLGSISDNVVVDTGQQKLEEAVRDAASERR